MTRPFPPLPKNSNTAGRESYKRKCQNIRGCNLGTNVLSLCLGSQGSWTIRIQTSPSFLLSDVPWPIDLLFIALDNSWNQYLEETSWIQRNIHGCIIRLQSQYQDIVKYTTLKHVQSDNHRYSIFSLYWSAHSTTQIWRNSACSCIYRVS